MVCMARTASARLRLVVLVSLAGWLPALGCSESSARLPNIVLLYADDLGYGDLAIQNPESKIPTPNLDQLAREGIRFTDAHSSSGVCTPSRYALLTGRYHWRKFHSIVFEWGESVFSPERLTLPEMLKESGYATACFGKWHLGFDWSRVRGVEGDPGGASAASEGFDWTQPIPDGPLTHGFDSYFGDDVPNFPPYTWIENDRVLDAPTTSFAPSSLPTEGELESRPGPMVEGWRQDAVMPTLTERVVEWIGLHRNSEKPFFLYFAWTSPHAPIVPTQVWQGHTEAGGYGDFVAQSDHHAGQVLRALAEAGLAENTIVIFTSDNGPERYAYERVRDRGHRSSGPLRGVKRDLWEGGHRVPFVVRWPGVTEAGAVSDSLMSQIDLMATLAEIVGHRLPTGASEDSHSQLALWRGGESARESLVYNTEEGHFAIREGRWVLIDTARGGTWPSPLWFDRAAGYVDDPYPAALYDLDRDLGQRKNLYAEKPELVADLQALLERIRARGEVRN
jgi:arylsulfatase A